jgi:2OG-Fe(II) oxygenase superfamily/Tetrapyrrole (Corrin/Porphyrin) Methylases
VSDYAQDALPATPASYEASHEAYDLYIVGTGIVGVRQITREVDDAFRRCSEVLVVDSGFGVREHIQDRCPVVTDLIPVTYREGEPRIEAYDRMSTAVIEAALDHPPVAFAVYGHPHVFVYPTLQLTQAAEALGLRVKVLPGISALDALLIDVGLDPGFAGLQMYDATDLLLRRRQLLPDVPCILWQIGAVETVLHSTAASRPARFRRLQDYLSEFYPVDHELRGVFTSTYPLAPSRVDSFPLQDLAARGPSIPHGASLYIPPTELRSVLDDELHAATGNLAHLSDITIRPAGDGYRQPRDPLTDESGLHPASQHVVREDFLLPSEVEGLLAYCLDREEDFVESKVIQPGTTYGVVKRDHRRSRALFDLGDHRAVIGDRVRQCLPGVLEELGFPPFEPSNIEASLNATNDGGFFGVHNDNGHDLLHSRRLTFVYYLFREPQGFQGGDLRLFETRFTDSRYLAADRSERVAAVRNRVVFFPSLLEHEVMEVSCPSGDFADSRFAVNGWVHN